MKNTVLIFFCAITLAVFGGCQMDSDNDGNPNNSGNTSSKYAKEFLGEWIRMDTGERWYISGNAITVNGAASNKTVTLTKTAEQVITVKEAGRPDYVLFASRVAGASFNARVVLIGENENNAGRSATGSSGQKPPVKVTNPQQPQLPPMLVEPDPDTGELIVPDQIPGDPVVIVPDDSEWSDVKVEMIPWADQDMGIIPLARGVNLKASIRMANNTIDITELYADGSPLNYIIEIENIGTENCVGADYQITWDDDDFSLVSGLKRDDLHTIVPGAKRQIELTLCSIPIAERYKNKEIKVTITSFNPVAGVVAKWEDTVSVSFYRETVPFNIKSQKPVQGVIRTPRNKTYYFKTSGQEGNCSYSMDLPRLDEDYIITFLGASVETLSETKYSLAIDAEPSVDWESLYGEDRYQYDKVSKSVDTAPVLDLGGGGFMYYLYTEAVQYFRVNMGTGVNLNKYAFVLLLGDTETLTAAVYPKNTANQAVTWSSDNPAVATVDGSGTVSAVSSGTAKISATAVEGGKTAECIVTVRSQNYTVVYDANGGDGSMENSGFIYGTPQNLRANAFTRTDYIFTGWAVSSTGTAVYTDEQSVRNLETTAENVATLYAVWGHLYTVAYNSNGGVGSMENTGFVYGIPQNLQANAFTRTDYIFAGWALSPTGAVVYTDGQSVSDLTTTAGAEVPLYAVWHQVTVVPGSNLAAQFTWLQTNALSGTVYTVEVSANESISPTTLSYSGRTNIGITLISTGAERVISLSSNGTLFTVERGVTLTLDNNITLQGRTNNSSSLVRVNSGGTLVMNTEASVSGNSLSSTASAYGGGVYVASSGTFTMHGGKISGNSSASATTGSLSLFSSGGGVYVASSGTFTMHGGEISGNSASSSSYSTSSGGGVYVYSDGTFTMYGGKISGNSSANTSNGTAYVYGGGVYVASSGNFTMHDGEISGNSSATIAYYSEAYGGGVYSRGTFTMHGGKISGNSSSAIQTGSPNLSSRGGGVYSSGSFTMRGGEISGNSTSTSTASSSYSSGGGVYLASSGIFRIVTGTIYGSNEAVTALRNTAGSGSALYNNNSTAQYGTFSGSTWNSSGSLATTTSTIRVVNGVRQ